MSVTVCPSPLMCPVVGQWPRVASVFLMFVSHAFLFWRRPVVAVFCVLAGNTFIFCVFHAPMVVSLAVLVLSLFQLFQDVLRLPCRQANPTERNETHGGQEAAQKGMRKHGSSSSKGP